MNNIHFITPIDASASETASYRKNQRIVLIYHKEMMEKALRCANKKEQKKVIKRGSRSERIGFGEDPDRINQKMIRKGRKGKEEEKRKEEKEGEEDQTWDR